MKKEDRGCPDCICALLFFCFLGSMIGLTFLGFRDGDVGKLIAPVAKVGDVYQLCGYASPTYNNELYPKLVIKDWSVVDVIKMFDSAICVEACPTPANEYELKCN